MRNFATIERDLGLKVRDEFPAGTGHISADRTLLVRRLDRDVPPALAEVYADVHRAAQAWVERDWDLEQVLRVNQPVEVGSDFIAFPFVIGSSTREMTSSDDPDAVLPEIATLRERYGWIYENTRTAGDEVITAILTPRVLEPSYQTIDVGREEMFVIIDLLPTLAELQRWAALTDDQRRISTRAEMITPLPDPGPLANRER